MVGRLQRQHALLTDHAEPAPGHHQGSGGTEAEERWGDTDAWKQSRQRTAGLTKDDWVRIKADGAALLHALAEAKRAGVVSRFATRRRVGGAAPHVDRAVLRMRRRDAPQAWWRCIWPTSGSPGTTTTSNPGWRSSSTTSSSKAQFLTRIDVSLRPMAGHPPSGTVTFLLTDLEGSTRMWEQDPVAMKAAMVRHDELLEKTIAAHRGYVFARMGDGMAAAFATARDAVCAAAAFQQALAAEPWGTARSIARQGRAAHRRGGDRR